MRTVFTRKVLYFEEAKVAVNPGEEKKTKGKGTPRQSPIVRHSSQSRAWIKERPRRD